MRNGSSEQPPFDDHRAGGTDGTNQQGQRDSEGDPHAVSLKASTSHGLMLSNMPPSSTHTESVMAAATQLRMSPAYTATVMSTATVRERSFMWKARSLFMDGSP